MDKIVYRCGWCGSPTDKNGMCLTLDEVNTISQESLDNAEPTHGQCCAEEASNRTMLITHDMAMDAQDLSLEGQEIEW